MVSALRAFQSARPRCERLAALLPQHSAADVTSVVMSGDRPRAACRWSGLYTWVSSCSSGWLLLGCCLDSEPA